MDGRSDLSRLVQAWHALTGQRKVIADPTNTFTFNGRIRISELPFETEEEYRYWWLPEVAIIDGKQLITRAARMTAKDKERYAVQEVTNLLTGNGRTQILGFIGTPTYIASQTAFAQYFSVGTYPMSSVSAGDTSIPGELARVAPSSAIISGTQIDIQCFFGTSQGNGAWTNCGLFGAGATSSLGTGTLMTHSLSAYSKVNTASVTVDYLINLT